MQTSTHSRTVAAGAVTALLAPGSMAVTQNAAAGKNDCGTSVSSCAGTAKLST
jgi:hypothetical protein